MKSLFNLHDNSEIIIRINRLSADQPALWGKMNVAQMLAHCQQPLKVATGEAKASRTIIGRLFGSMAKKQLLGDVEMKKNLPTDKTFVITGSRQFDEEKEKLIQLVERFRNGPAILTKGSHPFFGKLTVDEWDKLSWKHLDHHLRQFGV